MKQQLKILTLNMADQLSYLHEKFKERQEIPLDKTSYFSHVKNELDELFDTLELWYEISMNLIRQKQLAIPISMIDSTRDNMKQLMMHSYYYDVRVRRYNELQQSCRYVFNKILKEIHHES